MIQRPNYLRRGCRNRLFLATVGAALAAVGVTPTRSSAAIIKASADTEVREQTNVGTGTSVSINSRWLNTGANNEVMAYRFDLTGIDRSQITAATLNLTNYRDNTTRTIHAFGVADGATGTDTTPGWDDNTWSEATAVYSTMPGLVYDNNAATHDETGTDLGAIALSTTASLKGTLNTFADPAIANFLINHPDDVVTILVRSDNSSSGQARMASREATSLENGTPSGAAGDFAPYLDVTLASVPEPSLAVFGLAALPLLRRRRRP